MKIKLPDIGSSGRAVSGMAATLHLKSRLPHDRIMCSFDKLKLRLVEAHDRVLVVEEGLVNVVGNENQNGPT